MRRSSGADCELCHLAYSFSRTSSAKVDRASSTRERNPSLEYEDEHELGSDSFAMLSKPFFDEYVPAVAVAATHGRLHHVWHWVEHAGADVDAMDHFGTRPLHRAAVEGHAEIVQYLLSQGSDVNARIRNDRRGDTPLLLASSRGHVRVVSILVSHDRIALDAKSEDEYTALLAATRANSLESVRELVAKGAALDATFPLVSDTRQRPHHASPATCLHLAVWYGHVDLVTYLIQVVGMDVNLRMKGGSGAAPLHLAAKRGHVDVVQTLLNTTNVEVDVQDARGMTPLHYAADYTDKSAYKAEEEASTTRVSTTVGTTGLDPPSSRPGRSASLFSMPRRSHSIQSLGRRQSDGIKALDDRRVEREMEHVKVVEMLVSHGAAVRSRRMRDRATPVRCAAQRQHFLIARRLLDFGAKSSTASRWLFAVVYGREPDRVRMLASNPRPHPPSVPGGDSHAAGSSDSMPTATERRPREDNSSILSSMSSSSTIHTNVRMGTWSHGRVRAASSPQHVDAWARPLARAQSADVPKSYHAIHDFTPLHLACMRRDMTHLESLQDGSYDVNARTLSEHLTPLHVAAQYDFHQGVVWLLKRQAQVHVYSRPEGLMPLHYAVQSGHLRIVRLLLRAGADVNTTTKTDGTSAILLGLLNGRSRVVKYLVRHGASVQVDERHVVHVPRADSRLYVPSCVDKLPRHETDRTTAMHVAAFLGDLEALEEAVCQGGEVDASDADGATPLWLAALVGRLRVVEYLAEKGADLTIEVAGSGTPAMNAAEFGHLECLEYLTQPTPDRESDLGRLSLRSIGTDASVG